MERARRRQGPSWCSSFASAQQTHTPHTKRVGHLMASRTPSALSTKALSFPWPCLPNHGPTHLPTMTHFLPPPTFNHTGAVE